MARKLPRLTARQVVKLLEGHGFERAGGRGSHQKWRHPATRDQVIVPAHKGKTLPIGTLLAILRGSGIPEDEWP